MSQEERQIKILFVEDNDHDRSQVIDFVEKSEYQYILDCAHSYKEAVEKLSEQGNNYDVALLDYDLGDGTGVELLPFTNKRQIPSIFMAGNSNGQIVMEAIRSGAYEYLIKDSKWRFLKLMPASISNALAKKANEELILQKNQELEEINNELSNFAHIVSHDLKAPLRAMSSLISWIKEDIELEGIKLNDEMTSNMDLLTQKAEKMSNLIDSILEYSKVSRSKQSLEELKVQETLTEVLGILEVPEGINVEVSKYLPVIKYDKTHLYQLFQNLISNSIKYMGSDSGEVKISCTDRGNNWEFRVKDTGMGIDPRYHKSIFQIFKSVEGNTNKDSTGIGLTIIKRIIEEHGGKIWLESELNKGTSFFFTVPKT